ncbi:Rv3235 family protein [Streptomyces sp. bgisy032]|uniref:Rv3235 family protein n=2 Tax=unclassified Streptomyces TaxID=2593676 RepID=UPI003D714915
MTRAHHARLLRGTNSTAQPARGAASAQRATSTAPSGQEATSTTTPAQEATPAHQANSPASPTRGAATAQRATSTTALGQGATSTTTPAQQAITARQTGSSTPPALGANAVQQSAAAQATLTTRQAKNNPHPAQDPATARRTGSSTTPPRIPGGGRRMPAAGDRPPGAARARRGQSRPADTRPPTLAGTRSAARRTVRGSAPAPADTRTPVTPETGPRVPSQTPRRPLYHPLPTDRFADLLVAVLSGHRPVHSMLRHTRGRAYDELARLAERGPLRTRGARPVVRDIGYFEPRPGAIEAFARIGAGDRLRAMAFRLELGQDLRWRCTAVELGGPRRPRADDD